MSFNIESYFLPSFNHGCINHNDTYDYSENLNFKDRIFQTVCGIFQVISLQFQAAATSFNHAFSGVEIIKVSKSDISSEDNKIIKHLARTHSKEKTGFSVKSAIEFIKRGGCLQLASKNDPVIIYKDEAVITGCTAGYNRSQILSAYLKQNEIETLAVMAGKFSAVNPHTRQTKTIMNKSLESQQAVFRKIFNTERKPVLGSHLGDDPSTLKTRRKWYSNFFKNLNQPVHFVVFSESATSAIQRLIEKKGSLEGYKISYLPLEDTIYRDVDQKKIKKLPEAIEEFYTSLKSYVLISE